MRHVVWLVVALSACEKKPAVEQQPALARAAAGDAAVPDTVLVDARAARIDLMRAVPMVVRVSSQVRNRKILPRHIVDRDLATAWNSATGELAGSWIEVELRGGGEIEELRLTAGFTGRGPKGEDYFTMNPRIAKVTVESDGGTPTTVALDPAKRELQAIPVHATKHVRIEVVELVPGSKKNWREVSVSELEAWGAPPAGWTPPPSPLTPTVFVAPPIASEPCADIEERKREFEKQDPGIDSNCEHGCDDKNYPPDCHVLDLPTDTLSMPWRAGFGECDINDEIYGPKTCTITFKQGALHARITVESANARADVSVTELVQQDVVADGAPELIVRLRVDNSEYLAVCRATKLACTDAIQISDDGWKTRPRFVDGELVLDQTSGTAPQDVLGAHPLAF